MLEELGKSKSCEETPGMVRRRRRRQAAKNTDVEMKRKSVYCKDFCRYWNLLLCFFNVILCLMYYFMLYIDVFVGIELETSP